MQIPHELLDQFREALEPLIDSTSKVRLRSGTGRGQVVNSWPVDQWEDLILEAEPGGPCFHLEALDGSGKPLVSRSTTMPPEGQGTQLAARRTVTEEVMSSAPPPQVQQVRPVEISEVSMVPVLLRTIQEVTRVNMQLASRSMSNAETLVNRLMDEREKMFIALIDTMADNVEARTEAGILEAVSEATASPDKGAMIVGALERLIKAFAERPVAPGAPGDPCPVPPPVAP